MKTCSQGGIFWHFDPMGILESIGTRIPAWPQVLKKWRPKVPSLAMWETRFCCCRNIRRAWYIMYCTQKWRCLVGGMHFLRSDWWIRCIGTKLHFVRHNNSKSSQAVGQYIYIVLTYIQYYGVRCTECKVQHVQARRFAPHGEDKTTRTTTRTTRTSTAHS